MSGYGSLKNKSDPKKFGGMGFKRIREFNLAMLGKQAWRILTNPDTFIARLLKARYFPRSEFGQARIGNNPSYVWRSIMAAQQMVCNGTVRRIGNGESVNIWKDQWLPNVNQPRITTPVWNGLEDAKVSGLMVSGRREWDMEILTDLFNENDCQQILRIPLSSSRSEDSWLWVEGEKGLYSVKSAYRSLCNEQSFDASVGVEFCWLKVWNLSVPPKIKNFIWRALRDCLPTLDNLRRRGVEVYPLCPVCQEALENTEHVVFSCSFAQNCWVLARVIYPSTSNLSFRDILYECFQSKSLGELEIICSVAWQLWSHRNSVVWKKRFQQPSMVVNSASSFLFQWQRAQSNKVLVPQLNNREGVIVWQKPDQGWLTCNVDAAVFEREGKSSFGCVLRNDKGQFVAGCAGPCSGVVNPKHAEALAFKEALSWLKKLQVTCVNIELDSQVVVQEFASKKRNSSYLGSIMEDCHLILKDLGSYSVYFIRRSANSVAHALSREAGSLSDRKDWCDVPSFLIDVLSREL